MRQKAGTARSTNPAAFAGVGQPGGAKARLDLSAVILAGGASSRMGRDKAWVKFRGQTLLATALEKIRWLGVEEIFISGRPEEDYTRFKCPVLLDVEAGQGPLAGIERGLHACHSSKLLVLAVDLPAMTVEFLQELLNNCDERTGAVPKLDDGLEPLAAIYPRRCHGIARELLAQRRFAARGFAEACLQKRLLRLIEVADTEANCFANCNSPSELAVARTARHKSMLAKTVKNRHVRPGKSPSSSS